MEELTSVAVKLSNEKDRVVGEIHIVLYENSAPDFTFIRKVTGRLIHIVIHKIMKAYNFHKHNISKQDKK